MSRWLWDTAKVGCVLGLFYLAACALGFGFLVLGFKLKLLSGVDILFYRGLALVVVAFVACFALLGVGIRQARPRLLGSRDAFAAAVLSLSLNLSFLVVVPVTVDRSISIFMLAQMDARPEEIFTPSAMTRLFTQVYVTDRRQIDRRLYEQSVSGNLDKDGEGYRISRRGRAVIAAARVIADLFDSHAGLLASAVPPSPSAQARR